MKLSMKISVVIVHQIGTHHFKFFKWISFAFGFLGNFKYLVCKEYMISLGKTCLMGFRKDSKGCVMSSSIFPIVLSGILILSKSQFPTRRCGRLGEI